jgi:hypothetical protein
MVNIFIIFYINLNQDMITYLTGCTLPKTSNVEWDCENGYVFPNVSVYTTCEPRCQDNNMILVKQGTESYRCNEDKQWENDPATVSCKYEGKSMTVV